MRMTRKWASCSARGRICFAHDLLELSERQQDYVIVHELLHLRHPNHGKVFTALCRAHLKRPMPPPKFRRSAGSSKGTTKVNGPNPSTRPMARS